ncbi:hypothetical protein AAHA92_29314 [Salvia divinorum]|uniref:Uncharacterized protein n=1 Tax=Salvia divinorum TaxID=28513 RepID=A0ABD1FY02_SALDI
MKIKQTIVRLKYRVSGNRCTHYGGGLLHKLLYSELCLAGRVTQLHRELNVGFKVQKYSPSCSVNQGTGFQTKK